MKPFKNWKNDLGKTLILLGPRGIVLFIFNTIFSFILSAVEYGFALFLMVFLFSLEFIEASQLPSWIPIEKTAASPFFIWIVLFLIGSIQAVSKIIVYQSKIMLTETTSARMKLALIYRMLKIDDTQYMPLSQVNLYMVEHFPKTSHFFFYAVQLFSFSIRIIMIGLGMFYIAAGPALVGVLSLALTGTIIYQINRFNHNIAKKVPHVQEVLERTKVHIVKNWLLIKILRLQHKEYSRFIKAAFNYYKWSCLAFFYANLGGILIPAIGIFVIALIVITNHYIFNISSAALIAFLYLFVRFQTMLGDGSNLFGLLFSVRVQFKETLKLIGSLSDQQLRQAFLPDRNFKLFSVPEDIVELDEKSLPDSFEKTTIKAHPPEIKINNISFAYPGMETPVFSGLSFTIASGIQLGITGPNGCGKSTLIAILLGALNPDSGQVLMDGVDCKSYVTRHSASLGLVSAEPYLLHGTIHENITYGVTRIYHENDVWNVLRLVELDQFVKGLPGGLGYPLQENGEGLSSGQKQRLTIARALFRNPSLFILDEPTANLDNESETCIRDILYNLKGKCTVIVVSHKPGILEFVDQHFVLGEIT